MCDVETVVEAQNREKLAATIAELKQQLETVHCGHLGIAPKGYKLLKDTTYSERAWFEDAAHENGNYYNTCTKCLRQFTGHKRRVVCRACSTARIGEQEEQSLPKEFEQARNEWLKEAKRLAESFAYQNLNAAFEDPVEIARAKLFVHLANKVE